MLQSGTELTEDLMQKSCLSFGREKKTEEVIPAKQVIDAALTFQRKGKTDLDLC